MSENDIVIGDVTEADLLARIQELREANEKLLAKKERKLNPKPSLPIIEHPDSKLFVTDKDVANLMVSKGVLPKVDVPAARNMIHMFKLQPGAQQKAPGKAGQGKRLFQLVDIENVINYLLDFPG